MSTVSTGTVRYRAEAGASLLETMVAGALGVVIIGTALQLFVTHHGHFLGQRTQAELQQDIRWGVQLLAAELRLAGALPDQASLCVGRGAGAERANPSPPRRWRSSS